MKMNEMMLAIIVDEAAFLDSNIFVTFDEYLTKIGQPIV